MKSFILILTSCTLSSFSFAVQLDSKKIQWILNLKNHGVSKINVCGDANIVNSAKSLNENFLLGVPKKGLVYSGLPSYKRYWEILKQNSKRQAEVELEKEFMNAILWKISADNSIKSLGKPKNIEPKFKTTVKECLEGAEKTIGGNCKHIPVINRESCCLEKFAGLVVTWKESDIEADLLYSPDPSVRLRVIGEKKHRYCQVVDSINL